MKSKTLIYCVSVALTFLLLKYAYTLADNNDLGFLLLPTERLLGFITGTYSEYLSEYGYYFSELNITIDKSCSGYNFWILSFMVFSYLLADKNLFYLFSIPICLLVAYLLAILVNTSRIYTSIIIQPRLKPIFPGQQHISHEAIGVMISLSLLILAYSVLNRFITYKK